MQNMPHFIAQWIAALCLALPLPTFAATVNYTLYINSGTLTVFLTSLGSMKPS